MKCLEWKISDKLPIGSTAVYLILLMWIPFLCMGQHWSHMVCHWCYSDWSVIDVQKCLLHNVPPGKMTSLKTAAFVDREELPHDAASKVIPSCDDLKKRPKVAYIVHASLTLESPLVALLQVICSESSTDKRQRKLTEPPFALTSPLLSNLRFTPGVNLPEVVYKSKHSL